MAKYNLRINGNGQTIDSVYADKPDARPAEHPLAGAGSCRPRARTRKAAFVGKA
jgi:hypothetical protein